MQDRRFFFPLGATDAQPAGAGERFHDFGVMFRRDDDSRSAAPGAVGLSIEDGQGDLRRRRRSVWLSISGRLDLRFLQEADESLVFGLEPLERMNVQSFALAPTC